MRRLLLPALLALTLTACSVPSVAQIQNAPLPPTAMLESAEEPIQYTVELADLGAELPGGGRYPAGVLHIHAAGAGGVPR